jgi:ABC-type transporter Mla subunit MlaD
MEQADAVREMGDNIKAHTEAFIERMGAVNEALGSFSAAANIFHQAAKPFNEAAQRVANSEAELKKIHTALREQSSAFKEAIQASAELRKASRDALDTLNLQSQTAFKHVGDAAAATLQVAETQKAVAAQMSAAVKELETKPAEAMKAAAQDVCNKVETVVHYYERLDTALQKAIESLPDAMQRVNENFVRDVLEEARRGGAGPKRKPAVSEAIPVQFGADAEVGPKVPIVFPKSTSTQQAAESPRPAPEPTRTPRPEEPPLVLKPDGPVKRFLRWLTGQR